MKIRQIKQKGFTLLETLIAIFILTLSITGPIYIASLSFRNTIDSRDNISAQYLSEEVIEVIKNKRDKRSLEDPNQHWLKDTSSILDDVSLDCFNENGLSDNKCIMNWDDVSKNYVFESCNGLDCQNISFDPVNSVVYGKKDVSGKSKFIREFYFEKGENDTSVGDIPENEVNLIVNIRWQDKGVEKIYSLTERLYAVNYNKYFSQ